MKALVTGSGGLIGSRTAQILLQRGWTVVGVDNDLRAWLFGPQASTLPVIRSLAAKYPRYQHYCHDVRDRMAIRDLVREHRPALVLHCAGQPSHEKAAEIPVDDFDINTIGTSNLLAAVREYAADSPFCFTSTNKVYGDRPNRLPLVEGAKRWDYAGGAEGIGEDMAIDQCLHSLFGASKTAADILCQEYGRYYGMPVGIFRCSCVTGAMQQGVAAHGFLNYIVQCAILGRPYTIFGYRGKQVRDQIHASDVAQLFLAFHKAPRCGEVYNVGGGRSNSISILETNDALAARGFTLQWTYEEKPRRGDHICYITDLRKTLSHFPSWRTEADVGAMLDEITARYQAASGHAPASPG
jgi:CDP-paratose 2-epimerase